MRWVYYWATGGWKTLPHECDFQCLMHGILNFAEWDVRSLAHGNRAWFGKQIAWSLCFPVSHNAWHGKWPSIQVRHMRVYGVLRTAYGWTGQTKIDLTTSVARHSPVTAQTCSCCYQRSRASLRLLGHQHPPLPVEGRELQPDAPRLRHGAQPHRPKLARTNHSFSWEPNLP